MSTTTISDHASALPAAALVEHLRTGFRTRLTRPLEWRRGQLQQLRRLLVDEEDQLVAALAADLGRPWLEAWSYDLALVVAEIDYMLGHLDKWAAPERVHVPMVAQPGRAHVVREPLGVVLVIAPWNYPVQLLLLPMAAAIAAGNAVVGKPSELAPTVAARLGRLVGQYLDQRAVAIVDGGIAESSALLQERWDHIFYTGNGRVGRIVMAAAARHLTPVTLELGGKSPVIVDRDADLSVAARRIAWGKFVNAGQTCVAPDYVLVHRDVERPLLDRVSAAVRSFYGDDPRKSADYGRIVDDRHFARLSGLLDAGGYERVAMGGDRDPATRYLAPTVLSRVKDDAPVMSEEIFGPILAVQPVDSVGEAIDRINDGDKPLALYAFTGSRATAHRIVDETSSGGVCLNGTLLQLGVPGLPFGGVGASGMGCYHGRYGFDTFSHRKAVLSKPTKPDLAVAYPPYSRWKRRLIRRIL